jgi:hypothetical protein
MSAANRSKMARNSSLPPKWWSTISVIVVAVNPRAANTSVAASRMRCCVASVFAQRLVAVVMKTS